MRSWKRDLKDMRSIQEKAIDQMLPETRKNGAGNLCYAPAKGYAWNPLVNIERNRPCPCGSGKKFKVCHLPGMPRIIPEELAKEYAAGMKAVGNMQFTDEEPKEEGDAVPPIHV